MAFFNKRMILLFTNLFLLVGIGTTIANYSTSVIQGEASTGNVNLTIPTTSSDGTTALTTSTIFTEATIGLNTISPSQTIISNPALLSSNIYAGISGYLLGNTSTSGGSFAFKTAQYITSISATFTKYSSELSTVYLRSGGSAKATTANGEIGVSQTFIESDSTITLTWSPVTSYYFNVGTNTATNTTNNAYLTSLSFTYDNTMQLSLYKSFNLSDGGSSSNSTYTGVNLATNISYETNDPVGGAATAWEADYANLSLSYGARFGSGGTAKTSTEQTDNTSEWANLKTTFSFEKSIDMVRLMNVVINSDSSSFFQNYILQYSSDSASSWTTISTKLPSSIVKGVLKFDGFTIPQNSRIRIGFTWTGTSSSIQTTFTGIEIYSYEQC